MTLPELYGDMRAFFLFFNVGVLGRSRLPLYWHEVEFSPSMKLHNGYVD